MDDGGQWRVATLLGEHSCDVVDQPARLGIKRKDFIIDKVSNQSFNAVVRYPAHNQISRLARPEASSKARDVISTVRNLSGVDISYLPALQTINRLHNNTKIDHGTSSQQLPAYLECLKASDPSIYATILYNGGRRVHGFFVAPTAIRNAWPSLRDFIAINGTFPKGHSKFTLLLACTYDSQRHIVIMAWAVVPSESSDSWRWFCNNLRAAYDIKEQTIIISDRSKVSSEPFTGIDL